MTSIAAAVAGTTAENLTGITIGTTAITITAISGTTVGITTGDMINIEFQAVAVEC